MHRLRLSLQLVGARVLVRDGHLRGPASGFPHEDLTGLGCGLDAGGRVHQVSRHHPLAGGRQVHGGLPGEHPGPSPKTVGSHL